MRIRKERTLQNIYFACQEEGSFLQMEKVDIDQISDLLNVALLDFAAAQEWSITTSRESGRWNAIYKIFYDVLHALSEAFVAFDALKIKTHECLFAYLCLKHPELELDWNFFEKVRTKRNGTQYYGRPLFFQDWKEVEVQMLLYIKTLKKAMEEKLKKT